MLRRAVERAEQGLIYADLGGNVLKQRVGRRGSHRVLIFLRRGELAFLADGFAKNERANISAKELEDLQAAAEVLLGLTPRKIAAAVAEGALVEVPELTDDDDAEAQQDPEEPA